MKQLRFLLIGLAFFFLANNAQASHMIGAEITYKCLDDVGNYKVTLVYYRDCNGIATCAGNCSTLSSCTKQIDVRGADPSCAGVLFGSFLAHAVSVRDINPNLNCPDAKTICSGMGCVTPGTLTPGIERYEFEGIVDFRTLGIPGTCCKVNFSYQECCRNAAIQNITPGNFYTEATVNRCAAHYPNCHSPVSYVDPIMVMCTNQPFKFSFGAYDADLDSLSYEITASLENFGVTASYISPYTYNTPLPYLAPLSGDFPYGFHFDSKTGELAFTPQSAGWIGTFAIKIKEWRTIYGVNTLVGQTRRDQQVFMKYCVSNAPPTMVTNPPGIAANKPKTAYTTCPGELICFDIIAKDTVDLTDTTFLSIDNNMLQLGLTFTPNYVDSTRKLNGPREDSYKVCWTPSDSAVEEKVYNFLVLAKDNKCPYPGITSQVFSIRVGGTVPVISGDDSVTKYTTHIYSTPLHNNSTYVWTVTGASFFLRAPNTIEVWWGQGDTGTVTVTEISPCDTLTSKMKITVILNQGLNETTNPLNLIIYPQPATNKLKLSGDLSNLVSGQLLSLDGKKLQTFGKYELQKGELMLNDFPTGVYVLSISYNQNRTSTQKISIVK